MDKITQEAHFRQRVLRYAAEHGVSASANRHRLSRKTVHKWKKRYDGTLESLKDRPRTPHHFPGKQTAEEEKLVRRYDRRYFAIRPSGRSAKFSFETPQRKNVPAMICSSDIRRLRA